MWATDASAFRVTGWGYYCLVTVMDDYSRFILARKLQRDMAAGSLIEVVQEAVDATGMTEVPVEDRTHFRGEFDSDTDRPEARTTPKADNVQSSPPALLRPSLDAHLVQVSSPTCSAPDHLTVLDRTKYP